MGCGANLIYPLLGAAMHGWCFVGVDITDTAVEWAERNAAANPHLQHLLEIRRVPHLSGSDAGTGYAPLTIDSHPSVYHVMCLPHNVGVHHGITP